MRIWPVELTITQYELKCLNHFREIEDIRYTVQLPRNEILGENYLDNRTQSIVRPKRVVLG